MHRMIRSAGIATLAATIAPAWLMVGGAALAQMPEPPRAAVSTLSTTPVADERLATNLVIVFDGSGSMAGEKIEIAKRSLAKFLASVPADWNVGLIVFDNEGVRESLSLGRHDLETINRTVASIRAGGGTPLGRTIDGAHKMLAAQRDKQQGYGRYVALVVTDGEATDKDLMARAAPALARDGIELNVIGFRLPGGHSLRQFASDYRDAGDEQQLSRALREIVAETPTDAPNYQFEPLTITDADLAPPKAFAGSRATE